MHIVFTGPPAYINEWAAACEGRGHDLYAAFSGNETELHESVAHFSEAIAPVVDIIVDLNLDDVAVKASRIETLSIMTPRHVPALSNTLFVTATEFAKHAKYPELLVGMAYLPSLLRGDNVELALPYGSAGQSLSAMQDFITSLGKIPILVEDYPGMVFPRVLATIVNEAVFALQQGVADEEAIDTAMKLGVNYPEGPLAWGRKIGFANILKLLLVMHAEYGDDRYRPAPLLRKLA